MEIKQKPVIYSIDDDPDIGTIIKHILDKNHYNVFTETSSRRAISTLMNNEIKPDLVLLDIKMPNISGLDVCSALQELKGLSLIPVVFLTSSNSEEDKAQAFSLGAVDFINKPIGQHELIRVVKKHLQTKKFWNSSFDKVNQDKIAGVKTEAKKYSKVLNYEQDISVNATADVPIQASALPALYSNLSKFKRFLSSQLELKTSEWDRLVKTTDDKIYVFAESQGIKSAVVARSLALFFKLKYLSELNSEEYELGILPRAFCEKNLVIPLKVIDGKNRFVICNPFNIELVDALKRFNHSEFFITEPEKILQVFYNKSKKQSITNSEHLQENLNIEELIHQIEYNPELEPDEFDSEELANATENEAPIISLVNRIIENAFAMGASDIHIEPGEQELNIRYRIDGKLRPVHQLQPVKHLSKTIASRIKIMSQLDISNRLLPQDGRIVYKSFNNKNIDFDLRVATSPMNYGEKIVMRIINKGKGFITIDKLGFSSRNLKVYQKHMRTPYGMILHVGPTGSGKSMSLYAAIDQIKSPEVNIQTAEDPIEYTLEGINQLQINQKVGLTFSHALRSYLRQDPDVILVGEIRDRETANISVEAALTGHLILSTLHTNDAASSVTRLLEMQVEPFMLSSTLTMICAQRLLRRLCSQCKIPFEPSKEERHLLGYQGSNQPLTVFKANGCPDCTNGYKGRLGVHEILIPDDAIRQAINHPDINSEMLKRMAVKNAQMITLYWDSMSKVITGITSIEEVLTNIKSDEFDTRPEWWLTQSTEERRLLTPHS